MKRTELNCSVLSTPLLPWAKLKNVFSGAVAFLGVMLVCASCQAPDNAVENRTLNEQVEHEPGSNPSWYRRILMAAGHESYATGYGTVFRFRNASYSLTANEGSFAYVRIQIDSLGNTITDSLTNTGIVRYVNESQISLNPKDSLSLFEQINSVSWFARLPHVLEEPAVRKDFQYLSGAGANEVVFRVSFSQAGGGIDFQDSYVFWADTVKNELTKLAYVFYTGKGGVRLRELADAEICNGLWLGSWKNYGSPDTSLNLMDLPESVTRGELPFLSSINNFCIEQKASADATE